MPSRKRPAAACDLQLALPLSPVRNSEFLSNHWLQRRLPLEPEWCEQAAVAEAALAGLRVLWDIEKDRVRHYGDEAGLKEKFIQPVFKSLGWHLKYQAYLRTREPDYALFLSDADLSAAVAAGRRNPDFWVHAAVVADAKAWHVNLDRPTRTGGAREYPPEQIEWYLNRSLCDFGILTNGRLWRVVPRELGPARPRFQTYLEVDLQVLLDSLSPVGPQLSLRLGGTAFDDFLRFYLLFGPVGFRGTDERKPLVHRAVAGSSEYSIGVGEELKDRVFEALRLCVEGFLGHQHNALDPERDMRACQEHSLVFLYRLLFVMYAEDRGLLPYRRNRTYTRNRSLARHRDDVATRLDDVGRGLALDYSRHDTALWADLQDLFDLIDRGHASYGVPAYNGGLFDPEADDFLANKTLPDWYLARVLDQLGRAPEPDRLDLGLSRVDYRDLAIRQLGTVYEGLLEVRPRYASCDMRLVRRRQAGSDRELIQPDIDPVPRGCERTSVVYPSGSIYLATDKGERRSTGSYYTPAHIVDQMVQKTLGVRCAAILRQLEAEIASCRQTLADAAGEERLRLERRLQELCSAFDDRVLGLRVLDPAMGSGHFLIRACQYLAEEIATNPFTRDPVAERLEGDEPTITHWKRRVAENCLYGVDVNPMAVELAKLALWLETVAADAPLTFLDHHLQWGDSLIGPRMHRLNSLPRDEGLLAGEFARELQSALPALVEPLAAIRGLPSDSVEHVKKKEDIYKRHFLPVCRRFVVVAKLWTAEAMHRDAVTSEQYARVVAALGTEQGFVQTMKSAWVQDALRLLLDYGVVPFAWELAYPRVFVGDGDAPGGGGFDVVLGNPPYEVLSERESGWPVGHLQRFFDCDPDLAPARGGKDNLYKLFVARCAALLSDGGYLSLIVPMSLLGDRQARGIRRMLLSHGRFKEIHAFPQKDDVARRVFPDAKLATALFVYCKRPGEHADSVCASYVHSGRYIEDGASALRTDRDGVEAYDPENLTIVSCSQEDWDLMAALPRERIARLRDYVEFFQGEVNQTVAAAKGFLAAPGRGDLVARGANISLYQLREASQGEDIFLDVRAFLSRRNKNSKAYHHRFERVGVQESSPQNNFRRIIACRIPSGRFCNHKVNYTTDAHARVPLELVLFVLNSGFADWYFRLGSTNAAVSHYQLRNIPCPRFGLVAGPVDRLVLDRLDSQLDAEEFSGIEAVCCSLAEREGCGPTSPWKKCVR